MTAGPGVTRRGPGLGAWILAGLLMLPIALAWLAPASLLPWYLQRQAPHSPLLLEQVSGSVWRGTAGHSLWVQKNGQQLPLGRLQWRLRLWPLLTGKLAFDLRIDGPAGQMSGAFRHGPAHSWHVTDLKGQAPVAFWARQQARLAVLEPGGVLRIDFPVLDILPQELRGRGELLWQNASFKLSPVNPIGTYRLNIDHHNLNLDTVSGALRLRGQGRFDPGARQIELSGVARADGPDASRMASLLYLLGPSQGGGVHSFRFTFAF